MAFFRAGSKVWCFLACALFSLLFFQEETTSSSPDNNISPKQPTKAATIMEETKKIPARQIILDIVLLYSCAVGFDFLYQLVGPVERGFFCNDESIRYPYRAGTVSENVLFLYCFSIVLLTVLLVEWYRLSRVDGDQGHYSEYEIGRSKMNKMIVRTFIFYGYFQVAFVLTYILTDLTKISVGRLRPHFLAVCQPNVNLTSCQNSEIFVDTYKCLGLNPSAIRQARQSFWSRHSSLSMVSSTFAVLYLQCRLHGLLPSQVVLPILQMSIMGMGMLISYSRIYENTHHWSDVLAGITVGVFVATLITVYVAKLFSTRNQEARSYEESKNLIPIPSYSAPSLPVKISKTISGSTTSSIANNNNLVV